MPIAPSKRWSNRDFWLRIAAKIETGQLLRVAEFAAILIEASYLIEDWSNAVFIGKIAMLCCTGLLFKLS